jgi:hypothetical protein
MITAADVHAPLFLGHALEQATDGTYATCGTYVTQAPLVPWVPFVRAAADALTPRLSICPSFAPYNNINANATITVGTKAARNNPSGEMPDSPKREARIL